MSMLFIFLTHLCLNGYTELPYFFHEFRVISYEDGAEIAEISGSSLS